MCAMPKGRLLDRMEGLGFELQPEAALTTLTKDAVKFSALEGENLPPRFISWRAVDLLDYGGVLA